jgi:hypothetical protein
MPDQYEAMTSQVDESGAAHAVDPTDAKKSKDEKLKAVKEARKLRESARWDERWNDFIKIYSNQYPYDELSEYDDVVVPNMVFSTVNVIVPSVAVNSPKITVSANAPEDEEAAQVVEAVVNHQWRAYDVQDQVRAAIKDFVILGHGWVKVVWETEEKEVKVSKEEYQAAVAQALMAKDQTIQADPGAADMFPDDDVLIKAVPTKKTILVKDQPKVTRVSPFDILVDPDAKVFQDARWVAERSYWPITVAKANEDWDASVRARLVPTRKGSARKDVTVENESDQSADSAFAEIWHFYDLVSGQHCVFAEQTMGFLVKPEDCPFPDYHPYVFVPNYEVPERFYPIGDVETIFPLQLELGMTRTAQINDRKRGRRITLFREAALGNQGVQDLRNGQDNVMIPVLKDLPFDDVFRQISSMGLQPEWYRADAQAMEDINSVSGIGEYVRGGSADIRRTATEVGVMQDAANARSADKLFKVEQAMGRVAERMIKLSQQFMDTDAVARVVEDSTVVAWQPYNRDALQGDFVFTVEAGSSQPQNESFRRQQANQMMDVFGQFIGSGLLDDQAFLAEIMRLNGFRNVEKLLGPGLPPPMPPEGPSPEQMPSAGGPPTM